MNENVDKSAPNPALKEREKELNCLYRVEELCNRPGLSIREIVEGIVPAIPPAWMYPEVCEAEVVVYDIAVRTPGFRITPWPMSADIEVQGRVVGRITVCYREERPSAGPSGVFLDEERKLLRTIADRVARRVQHDNLRRLYEQHPQREQTAVEWRIIVDLLRRTDPKLLVRVTRKMLYYLVRAAVPEATRIIEELNLSIRNLVTDENRPMARATGRNLLEVSEEIFAVASDSMPEREILALIQKWIREDRSGFLVRVLENPASSLAEITNAVERFHHLGPVELSLSRERAFRVSLIRRLLSDHADYISTAKQFLSIDDFYSLLQRVIHPAGSHGKLGGKAAGLVLASHVLQKADDSELLASVKIPKTWFLTSDVILSFIDSNDLEELIEIKYEDIAHVRQEYPYVINVFKNSPLPPDIINGLSVALDDLGERPVIVRSSSLLEDRIGTSFAGKYKSLFLANQGTKKERLAALVDAITEVFASTFGPDPIEYRAEHGLVDFHEEMGVMIQEVAGAKVGKYFLPAFSGVAFSNNEFRWSRRLRREDGLVRMVPGLGTRAVDRVAEDYPIMVAPGQPALRPNVTADEKIRYSPRMIDVINLENNELETVEAHDLLRECGDDYPMIRQLLSVVRDGRLEAPSALGIDAHTNDLVFTFDGLITRTSVVEQLRAMLERLQREMHIAIDLEFAHDGTDMYLLQCRPQSYMVTTQPAVIPHDVAPERIVFTAHKHISNGAITGITHVVYVDPQRYAEVVDRAGLIMVGRVISQLNAILPKRQFILMGPGRWGSRGDIRLGVNVTYSDINNTAMLVEIARRKGGYVPEPSFGTHFFQDLVEGGIRYLPLYPDEPNVVFNDAFLSGSENVLGELLPEFDTYRDLIRVIDVPRMAKGQTLQVLMNGETEEAMAVLTDRPLS